MLKRLVLFFPHLHSTAGFGLLGSWYVVAVWVSWLGILRVRCLVFFFFFQLVASFLVELETTVMVVVVWLCRDGGGGFCCGLVILFGVG